MKCVYAHVLMTVFSMFIPVPGNCQSTTEVYTWDQNHSRGWAWSDKSDEFAKKGDSEQAWEAEALAVQFLPDDPRLLRDFCHRSFDAGRYRDVVWSARQIKDNSDWMMSAPAMVEWSLSLGVLGDYEQASQVIREAIRRMNGGTGTEADLFPAAEWSTYMHEWDITFAYFMGDFDDALAADSNIFPSGKAKKFAVYGILLQHIQEIGRMAEKHNMRYAALKSQSYLNKLIREGIEDYYLYGYDADLKVAGASSRELTWKLIGWYRSMPIKPVPPPEAVAEYKKALYIIQNQSSSGDFSHESPWFEAEKMLFDVTRRVPWWAEPHYSLAILVKNTNRRPSNDYYDQSPADTWYITAQELLFCVGANPAGPDSAAAKKLLKMMKQPIPQ